MSKFITGVLHWKISIYFILEKSQVGIKELKKIVPAWKEIICGCQLPLNMRSAAVTQYHIWVTKKSTIHHVTDTPIKHLPIEHLFSSQYSAQQLNGEMLDTAPAVDIWNLKCDA